MSKPTSCCCWPATSAGAGQLTSNDTAEFIYPELFRSIGTIGHEMMLRRAVV